MKDYRGYTITDLILDEDFIRWVQENDPVDDDYWQNWIMDNPDRYHWIMEARGILESMHIRNESISEEEIQAEKRQLLQSIGLTPATRTLQEQRTNNTPRANRYILRILLVQALILTLATAGYYKLFHSMRPTTKLTAFDKLAKTLHLEEKINTGTKPSLTVLPDGSKARLSPNGRVAWPKGLDTASVREVYLSGEAVFQVVPATRPFYVIAGGVETKVSGPDFHVRSLDNDSTIEVTVKHNNPGFSH